MIRYGIVVLNYQKYEMTEKCISSLLAYGLNARILIVDNASTNDSFKYMQNAFKNVECVEIIRNSYNAGYAKGNNFGFRYLFDKYKDLEFCCVMNPDVEIRHKEIFDKLMSRLELDKRYAMATGLMVTNGVLNYNSCFWSIPKGMEIATGHYFLHKNRNKPLKCDGNGVAEVEVIPGSFFMIKRTVYEQLGGFDEGTFLYNEENILAIQLKKMGYVSILSVNDMYDHNHPKGDRKSLVQKLRSRKIGNASRRYLCKKYYSKAYLPLLDLVIAFNALVISIMHLGGNIKLLKKGKKQL